MSDFFSLALASGLAASSASVLAKLAASPDLGSASWVHDIVAGTCSLISYPKCTNLVQVRQCFFAHHKSDLANNISISFFWRIFIYTYGSLRFGYI